MTKSEIAFFSLYIFLLYSCDNKTSSTDSKAIKLDGDSMRVLNSIDHRNTVHYQTDDADILIFSKEYCDKLPYFGNCFSPTKSEVDTCEKYIKSQFKYSGTNNGKHSLKKYGMDTVYRDLFLYKRQYIGFINEEKDSILNVIAIHQSHIDSCTNWGQELCFYEKYGQNIRWEVSFSLRKKTILKWGGM